jgi:hypothetical protein
VYLRVGEADLAVAPFTTDADLAIDPAMLAHRPALERKLRSAGFLPEADNSVGIWITKRATSQQSEVPIAVDLLVPASVSPGKGRRAARLPGHDTHAARIVKGLEGVLVDVDEMKIEALDASDTRTINVRVAGPAALLVAKVHKIDDRRLDGRQSDKDALDVFRLLRTETADLAERYKKLFDDPRSKEAAKLGRALLEKQFATRDAPGVEMAIRSAGVLADENMIAASCVALTNDLLAALPD